MPQIKDAAAKEVVRGNAAASNSSASQQKTQQKTSGGNYEAANAGVNRSAGGSPTAKRNMGGGGKAKSGIVDTRVGSYGSANANVNRSAAGSHTATQNMGGNARIQNPFKQTGGNKLNKNGQLEIERPDSYYEQAIKQIARGDDAMRKAHAGTWVEKAGDELKALWDSGQDAGASVKNGQYSFLFGDDRTDARVWHDFDADGNWIKTANQEYIKQNEANLSKGLSTAIDYANSGVYNSDDTNRQIGNLKEWQHSIEKGLLDDYDLEDGTKLSSLIDGLLTDYKDIQKETGKQNNIRLADSAATRFNQMQEAIAAGNEVDYTEIQDYVDNLTRYAEANKNDAELSGYFNNLAKLYAIMGNRVAYKEQQAKVEEYKAEVDRLYSDALIADQNVAALDYSDVVADDATRNDLLEKKKTTSAAYGQAFNGWEDAKAQVAKLEDEYRQLNMTPEVEAAMQRLSIAELGKAYSKEAIEEYVKSGKADASMLGGYQGVAEQMRREDQQLVDDWNAGIGLNAQYYNWKDRIGGVSKSFAARTAGSAANLAAWGAGAITYDGERLKVAGKLEQLADSLDNKAQAEIAKAKEGASKWGQFGLDFLSTTMDMGLDAMTGAGLYSMFARVMGSGIGEARRAGASSEQQFLYGLSKAAIEVATEKLTDGLGAIYGKGVSTDVVEKAISRLSGSDAGANFLRLLAGAVGEGGEEVISDLLDPFTKWIIDEGARDNRIYDIDLSEVLYDFLLGGAMGLLGQGVEAVNGSYAAKNAEIRQNDAAIIEKAENAEATGEQLSKSELKDLNAAQARQEQHQIKGGLRVNPNGSISTVTKGANRHETATNVLADNMEAAGYVNSTNTDEDYATATTGAEGPRTDAELNQQSYNQMLEEEVGRQAEAEEVRKAEEAQEAKRKEDVELEKQARIREQETEGARRAAQAFQDEQDAQLRAAEEAEKYAQLAHNAREFEAEQEFAQKAQQARQAAEEAGKKTEEQLAIANSQSAALEGQDTNPIEAPKSTDLATASETASEAQEAPTQANTQENPQPSVKLEENEQDEAVTSEEAKEVVDANGNLIYSFDSMNKNAPAANIKTGVAENGITGVATGDTASIAQASQVGDSTTSSVNVQPESQQQETGRTPGKIKQSQSAFEQDVATKGERANTDAAMGEAEFISRTNAARSQTADLLTDTQEKADAQAQRLLQEDYVWNDDDIVIAQKLMFDMVKAIRDYQLKKPSRMKPDAFRKMTEQYNQLMTKHQEKLSKAGQELQANYMFSTGDKIVMKAAQTFLGFTKDGRFAGASVNAKNAKIYAGIEEASKRIQKAVEAEDSQGLAKICKDISNIRNVKKMFGPLGGFASEMESRVLDRIAKGENAAQNLENLAYGNLNAICDDVQPYKPLNAAKTIRVMNMLSNTATIVNNLANNFAQGAVSKSMVNQAFSSLASKPFEALTGQHVMPKAVRGKEANRAVRNAQVDALEAATLMQMYGITEENGRLELNDRGMFNPNINPFEQTMSLYKFLTGMGVEATDKMQAAGILKAMELGIDADIKAGKIEAHTKEQRMQEARHEVNRLLYKDDNSTTALVQHIRDYLNKFHVGNDNVGTIGLGDITMAFAKIPANVVRARLAMTPEGALLQVAQYAKGVNKAKRMHAEVLARGIVEAHQDQIKAWNDALQVAYAMEPGTTKDTAIQKAKSELSKLNSKMWAEAQDACRGSVYKNLRTIAGNYNENMMFNEAVERAGYMNAKEMSQFEAAQLSRKIGRAATSVGMMALGSVLRALGALRDFDQEPDDELRKMNSDKGYRGLMMNLSAIGRKNHEWKDGDLIIDGEFLEVIAMPLTIGATAAEAAATAQDAKTWNWLKSMAGNGIAKTFEAVGDIPGMADAINMYESLTSAYNNDYDEKVSRLGAGLIQYAANTVPSFFVPNSISQATAGFDNKVRDVYAADTPWGQAKNIFMNKIPVLRNKVPVSVDVWGNERTYGEGLWGAVNKMLLPGDVHVYRKNKYENEIERMVKAGYGNATPKTVVNSSFEVGDEKYTMTAQEKLDYKAARNSQQRELYEAFIDSDYYKILSDAERMKVFQSLKTSAERDAKQDMLNGRQLDVEVTRDKWETELLDVNDQIQFLAAKQMANNVLDRDAEDMDYAAVDQYLTGAYKALNETQRTLLDSSYSRLDDMYEAKNSYGIGSEMFNTGYSIYKDYMSDEGRARVQGGYKDWEGSQMYTDIAKATGATEKQMDFFEKKFVLYNNNAVVPEKYNSFVDAGWDRESAQSLMTGMAGLEATNGRKTISYKQRLTQIALTPGLTEAQRWEAFYEYCPSSYTSVIRNMSNKKNSGASYEKALKDAGKWDA